MPPLPASALGVKRVLGVDSYETAWSWLHKLRRAMVRPGRDQLSGVAEVDETYVGGEEPGAKGRYTERKAIVAIAVEVEGEHMGRIRLQRVPNVQVKTLTAFVRETCEAGGVIQTDGWSGYRPLAGLGFTHEVTVLSQSPEPAHISMPHVHRVASLLKRWLLGTYQGAASMRTCNTTWTSSRSDSTAEGRTTEACFFTASWSRRCRRATRRPTTCSRERVVVGDPELTF